MGLGQPYLWPRACSLDGSMSPREICLPRLRTLASFVGLLLLLLPISADAGQQHPSRVRKAAAPRKPAAAAAAVDQELLATQVMLDRAGYSPGEIDAVHGTSTERALAAFTKNGGQAATTGDAITSYTITDQDVAGPFVTIPKGDMMALADLPALGYANVTEALGERFHASPTLLKRLNPGATFAAGETIKVPNVASAAVDPPVQAQPGQAQPGQAQPVQAQAAPAQPAQAQPAAAGPTRPAGGVTVTVHKSSSDLVVTDAAGTVLMYAPVTTGSEHDPLPIGEWKVNGVERDPKFHYNPALFWDANQAQAKATIAAGPNNPVGVVWVDISRPHYGLHGTPEPSTIGKTESHGCVRLTNWDALKLASLVKPGTRVVFAE